MGLGNQAFPVFEHVREDEVSAIVLETKCPSKPGRKVGYLGHACDSKQAWFDSVDGSGAADYPWDARRDVFVGFAVAPEAV